MSVPRLFTPAQVGTVSLKHRVVLTPLTRFRAHANHVPSDIAVAYYSQRASVPGTLLITEGTFIAAQAGGLPHVPGIWSDEQIAGWKRVRTKRMLHKCCIVDHGDVYRSRMRSIARAHISLYSCGLLVVVQTRKCLRQRADIPMCQLRVSSGPIGMLHQEH